MTEKEKIIDALRIKLKRLEFSLKEAVLFLGKPLLSYDLWLEDPDSGNPGIGAATLLEILPKETSKVLSLSNSNHMPEKYVEGDPRSIAAKQISSKIEQIDPIKPKNGASDFEIHCMVIQCIYTLGMHEISS